MKPTLLFHSPTLGRQSGGVGNSFLRILQHLSEHFSFIIVAPDPEMADFTILSKEIQIQEKSFVHYSYSNQGNRAQKDQFLADIILELATKHKVIGIGNFFVGDWSFAIHQASLQLDLPLFNFCRGNDIDLGLFESYKFDIIKTLEGAKRNFCVSREMENKILKVAPYAKTEVVYNSINTHITKHFEMRLLSKRPQSFGLIGHIKRKKGLELLLDKINYEAGDKLHIIGDLFPAQAKYLHGFLSLNQRYSQSIIHHSFEKDPKKLFSLMNDIDIICIPSLHDGMPNTLLESMLLGKIVIASKVGGIKDVLTHQENGFLFNPFDENALSETIRYVQELPTRELNKIQQKAIETIKNDFKLKKEKKRYLKIFESIFKLGIWEENTASDYSRPN